MVKFKVYEAIAFSVSGESTGSEALPGIEVDTKTYHQVVTTLRLLASSIRTRNVDTLQKEVEM